MNFKRQVSASGILFASIGAMVGSGWLFGPMYAAQVAGPAALISWLIAGIFLMVIAFTFAELGTMLPITGGVANYPYFTHGKFVGFLLGWISWLTFVTVPSIEVQAAIQYGSNFFPSLYEHSGAERHLTPLGYLWAALLMLGLVYINHRSVKFMSETNKFFSIWKLLVPIIAIVAFVYCAPNGFSNIMLPAAGGFAPYGWHGILTALAVSGIIFSFNGFQVGILMAAETTNPNRNIPLSIIGSVAFCFVLYALLQIAFIVAIPQSTLLEYGWDKLHFIGDAGPFAGIALVLGLGWLAYLLYVGAIVSPLGSGIVYVASSARLLYALGANGYLPPIVSKLNKKGIPAISVWINFVVGMIMFFPFPGWQSMVTFLASAMIACYMTVPICLVALRANCPNRPRPFRLPFYKIISFIAFYICNLMLFWTGWNVIYKLLIFVSFTTFIYFLFYRKESASIFVQLRNGAWILLYFIGFAMISKFGNYNGGNGMLHTGYDFGVIAIFSALVFYISQRFKLTAMQSENHIAEIFKFSNIQNNIEK